MAKGDFLWCDVSTFRMDITKSFYAKLFGWSYEPITQPDGTPYHIAASGAGKCAAVFEMPEKFRKIGLPSFWMSYIEVDSVEAAVAQARTLGGKVEVGPIAFGDTSSIALIRDPLGAGFTVYQGNDLKPRAPDAPQGHMAWNALYVSDAQAVIGFYETLFDWSISQGPVHAGTFEIRNARGDVVSAIHELPEAVRGKFQFWGVHFAVPDLSAAKAQVLDGGGKILDESQVDDEKTLLAQDPDGAAFFLVQPEHRNANLSQQAATGTSVFKWRTALALAVIWIAVVLELNWVWGVLFIMWAIPALRSGRTYFVELIERRTNPVLFWLLVGTWIVLSLFLILYDLGAPIGASA